MAEKAVVIYSGGMDSFTILNRAKNEGFDLYALTFDYGQRHSKEIQFAKRVCDELEVSHKIIDITAINQLLQSSSLTSDIEIPEGHYEAANMKSTVVPNRNMILLSLAIGYAVDIGANKVFYGAHSGDHAIYPDCSARLLMVERPTQRIHIDQVCQRVKLGLRLLPRSFRYLQKSR